MSSGRRLPYACAWHGGCPFVGVAMPGLGVSWSSPHPRLEDATVTAVIRRSLLQGLCGVGVVAALSLGSAAQEPVELTMITHEVTEGEPVRIQTQD